jgi:hypothetical protein
MVLSDFNYNGRMLEAFGFELAILFTRRPETGPFASKLLVMFSTHKTKQPT